MTVPEKHQKSVLITGCSPGGIGYAMAMEFHKRGCYVIATARKPEALQHLKDEGLTAMALEVTDIDSIKKCKEKVNEITGGRLDILVNNAGRSHTIPLTDIDLDDVRQTYETNVFGPMAMCQAFIPLLIPARGLIINISSVSSVVPLLFGGVYSSTKSALDNYARVLRLELEPFSVRVMNSMTGTVQSNVASHGHRQLPKDSLFKPVEDVFQARLTFSQTNATMATTDYASRVVTQALKGEGYLGGWISRTPSWFWAGGISTLAWTADTLLHRRFTEWVAVSWWGMDKVRKRLAANEEKRR